MKSRRRIAAPRLRASADYALELTQLQQEFATGGMGYDHHFAWQQSSGPNVRFGSKADISQSNRHVCFTPKSGH
jgi:hypothetical protein